MQTVRNVYSKFSRNEEPSSQYVVHSIKLREIGSLDKATHSRTRPVRSTENIATVAQRLREHPSRSTYIQPMD